MSQDQRHDLEAALRMLSLPFAALLQELETKGILSPSDTSSILEARESGDVCGPLSAAAHDMIQNVEKTLDVCRKLPILNR